MSARRNDEKLSVYVAWQVPSFKRKKSNCVEVKHCARIGHMTCALCTLLFALKRDSAAKHKKKIRFSGAKRRSIFMVIFSAYHGWWTLGMICCSLLKDMIKSQEQPSTSQEPKILFLCLKQISGLQSTFWYNANSRNSRASFRETLHYYYWVRCKLYSSEVFDCTGCAVHAIINCFQTKGQRGTLSISPVIQLNFQRIVELCAKKTTTTT